MKFMKLLSVAAAIVLVSAGVMFADSQYGTGSTETLLIFNPAANGYTVTGFDVTSDKAGSLLKFYGKATIADGHTTKSAAASGDVKLYLTDVTGFSISDVVIITGDGVTSFRKTISAVGATYIQFATAVGSVIPVNSKIYRITEIYRVPVGATSTNRQEDNIVRTIGDSPLVVSLDSTSASKASVTATTK